MEDSRRNAFWGDRFTRLVSALGATAACAALASSVNVVAFFSSLGWIANWVELW